jgi:hypothetical protein
MVQGFLVVVIDFPEAVQVDQTAFAYSNLQTLVVAVLKVLIQEKVEVAQV